MAASPVIAQWLAAKEQQPDALLFFRMGDFYELFFDDAALAASAPSALRSPPVGSTRASRSRCAACRPTRPKATSPG